MSVTIPEPPFLGTLPGGRLTTESGVFESTADRTAQGTLYWTPYVSDYLRLHDGTRVREFACPELSLALSGLTSGKNYDVFGYISTGSPALEFGAAWTGDTTRSTGFAWQTGLGLVKSGDPTRLYLGTARTTGTTTTEDSATKRFVWNLYNQRVRRLYSEDFTSHTYASTTAREWNGGTGANRHQFVVGSAQTVQTAINASGSNVNVVGVGLDTTAAITNVGAVVYNGTASLMTQGGVGSGTVAAGYHYLAQNELSGTGVTASFSVYRHTSLLAC